MEFSRDELKIKMKVFFYFGVDFENAMQSMRHMLLTDYPIRDESIETMKR
jgi:hypothetical protein